MEYNVIIESYLRKVLKVKPGSRTDERLHNFLQGIILHEQGCGAVSDRHHERSYQSYLKYFERAIDKLSKKHPELAVKSDHLKQQMKRMSTSDDMIWLYHQMRQYTEE